jgi:hypothetical protein
MHMVVERSMDEGVTPTLYATRKISFYIPVFSVAY